MERHPDDAGASPLKVYEYVAMGLHVVSTDLESVTGIPGVVIAQDPRRYADALRAVLAAGVPMEARHQMAAFALQQCWPRRVDTLLQLVDAARREPRRRSVLARVRDWASW